MITNKNAKALIVGGSNGIGLNISLKLITKGYHVIILDKTEPDRTILTDDTSYTYEYCDLSDFEEGQFRRYSSDANICILMITAGFGRVTGFEYLHLSEIRSIIEVNTIAGIEIISCFYDRIRAKKRFYCGMMGSIAGLISSPLFSVYAASKAGICRFTESVNIELEMSGTKNRILNVSPASIKGTRFNGGTNNLLMTDSLAEEIICRLFRGEELYIPDYDSTYKTVIDRYNNDAHEYGLHSYQYKMNSGRLVNEQNVCIGYLSGTFDLFHIGHLNLLRNAKKECDYLIVGIHPNAAHKGKETFIPFEERKQIVAACKYVDKVVMSCPEDCDAWELYHYNKLFVGSDYKGTERFARYEEYFKDKSVEIVYFPYTSGVSSTQIRKSILKTNE